jgi:hypothetical protein
MKKSAMGSSKYEFNPEQLEKDVRNRFIYKQEFKEKIKELILSRPDKLEANFRYALDTLKELKEKYNL